MNTFLKTLKTILSLTNTVSTIITKIRNTKFPQQLLFLLTGFLVSQFFLLNILYSQHPQGGWVTVFGSISTLSLLSVVLLAIIACLVALWRSASVTYTGYKKNDRKAYSKPTTFISVSPE